MKLGRTEVNITQTCKHDALFLLNILNPLTCILQGFEDCIVFDDLLDKHKDDLGMSNIHFLGKALICFGLIWDKYEPLKCLLACSIKITNLHFQNKNFQW